jgi:hypothetical protein
MNDDLIYLDTYVLQQDMRVRMPKSIIENLHVEKGKSRFAIYYDKINSYLVIKVCEEDKNINGSEEK